MDLALTNCDGLFISLQKQEFARLDESGHTYVGQIYLAATRGCG